VKIGVFPTPVRELHGVAGGATRLWVKHDDRTSPLYGGNKVRKAERLLEDARVKGASEIITVGAVGSNHVLTIGVFAKQLGIRVAAVVVAQPETEHVLQNLRADLAQGIELIPASSYAHAAMIIAWRVLRGAYYIPAGGSNPIGASGFVAAARELAAQVAAGELPEPDVLVVPLGSGGTTGGLAAGLALERMSTRVLAVTVAEPPWLVERKARELAKRCAGTPTPDRLLERLELDRSYLGKGYGHATTQSVHALEQGKQLGLTLEHTYTAKAFAAALDLVRRGSARNVLFWQTLSSAPMGPLLAGAPSEDAIDPRLKRLARPAEPLSAT
jgi:D-cysteine desulfhydrase